MPCCAQVTQDHVLPAPEEPQVLSEVAAHAGRGAAASGAHAHGEGLDGLTGRGGGDYRSAKALAKVARWVRIAEGQVLGWRKCKNAQDV